MVASLVSYLNISIITLKLVYCVLRIKYMILPYKDADNVQAINQYSMELLALFAPIIHISIALSTDVKIVQEEDITIILKNYVNVLKVLHTGITQIALNVHFLITLISKHSNAYPVQFPKYTIQKQKNV